jgi:hypothetical protein
MTLTGRLRWSAGNIVRLSSINSYDDFQESIIKRACQMGIKVIRGIQEALKLPVARTTAWDIRP